MAQDFVMVRLPRATAAKVDGARQQGVSRNQFVVDAVEAVLSGSVRRAGASVSGLGSRAGSAPRVQPPGRFVGESPAMRRQRKLNEAKSGGKS